MAKIELNTSSLDNSFEKRIGDEKKITPVVSKGNGLVSSKPSVLKRFKKAFITDDAKDVSDYILLDIIVPGIKNAILDTLERVFFNSSGRKRSSGGSSSKTSYSSYYKSDRNRREERNKRDEEDEIDYRNIIIERREDAEEIVRQMRNDISEHHSTSVAFLIDLIGSVAPFTYNNYGWTNEEDIGVKRVREGYLIDVPEAEFIGD